MALYYPPLFAAANRFVSLAPMRPILILAAVLFTASASAQDAQTPPPAPAADAPKADAKTAPQAPARPIFIKPTPLNQQKFDEAAAAYDAKDYDKAYKLFTELADEYDVAAMRNVALMTRDGLGTEKDPERAQDMMKEAARRGLPTAQYDLGEMLLSGAAGKPNRKAALPWFELAASAGHPLAQYRLAQLYEEGDVVPKDVSVAELLYAAAARRGYDPALQRLKELKGWTTVPAELYAPGPDDAVPDPVQPAAAPAQPKAHRKP
ncbi:MAG: tetratricopeptide repeat protein [Rhizomicrobium sp.]